MSRGVLFFPMNTPFLERIHYEPMSGCWIWGGATDGGGYGVYREKGVKQLIKAHRYCYQLLKGKITSGLDLDHKCRNRCCVNPDHLEPVTRSVNIKRGYQAHPTEFCKYGHPLSGDNMRIRTGKFGRKICVTCQRRMGLAYYYRTKEKREKNEHI
jgi:hypothetical protein